MMTEITKKLQIIAQSQWYWLVYIVAGLTFLAIALFFQYFLEESPCAMCIQVRLWVSLFVIVSIVGLLTRGNRIMNAVAFADVLVFSTSFSLGGSDRIGKNLVVSGIVGYD